MAVLPRGTLTFLFTDIEGSTRLWETQPDAMRVALARHDLLVRRNIEARRGFVFKTAGDAFCAAFATAPEALAAALDAQRELCVERWPKDARVKVRMALHTGASESRDGDYFGPPVNRVARLLAVAHGGQTLVSEITHRLCHERLPEGASLKFLGEHGLKDLARPEPVFQLCHPDLPQSFPPLRALLASVDVAVPSIAVLPFVNRSHDPEDEYFSDGLADELLNVLAKISGLRVAARTASFQFKGRTDDIAVIGEKLNVATVLEGSVRKAGNRMRISVQLVKVTDGYQLWSQSYDRTLEDIFAVQDDIAQSVVKELRSTLLGEALDATAATRATAQVAAAAKGRASDAEAHRLYLQARHLIGRATREDVEKGIGYLEQALKRDPEFALAWSQLGGAYATQASQAWDPPGPAWARSRDAIARALVLEPELADAHALMGIIHMSHDWDWQLAQTSFARALESAPGNAYVLTRAGYLAACLGRIDEAIGFFGRALERDVLSPHAHFLLGIALEATGRFSEAEHAYRTELEQTPQATLVHAWLGVNLLRQGRTDEALAEALREPEQWARLWALAIVYQAAGRGAEADAALNELIADETSASNVAQVYASRGEPDRAFEWLERAYVARDGGAAEIKFQPMFRPLDADPRWGVFLRKMGLPA